jgi:hypothetical protein
MISKDGCEDPATALPDASPEMREDGSGLGVGFGLKTCSPSKLLRLLSDKPSRPLGKLAARHKQISRQ